MTSTPSTTETQMCPRRCGHPLNTASARNALSRSDNTTYVCSSCGVAEAMFNIQNPGVPLPPATEPVPVLAS